MRKTKSAVSKTFSIGEFHQIRNLWCTRIASLKSEQVGLVPHFGLFVPSHKTASENNTKLLPLGMQDTGYKNDDTLVIETDFRPRSSFSVEFKVLSRKFAEGSDGVVGVGTCPSGPAKPVPGFTRRATDERRANGPGSQAVRTPKGRITRLCLINYR